ncbi:Wall-associated kinase family protein [Rhynchospora pubera]|uniref:Wall-associated kinase family protein n=1 Tax=Rhynchospora pubera TaxID=906938 RepID=A0AAV8HA48_9POAL|nr:Wall-associated kinase family protein [Rhynchospora pubera]
MQPHKVVMLITVLLLVELAATTAAPRKNLQNSKSLLPSAASLSHCPTKCGDMNISDIMVNGLGAGYPFGIGSGCFRSGLELICNPSTDSPELFLGDNSTRVALISYGYAIVKFNIHVMPRTVNSYNSSWSPGRPFTIYADDRSDLQSRFIVIGCGVDAYLLDENETEMGNCSTFCESERDTRMHIGDCSGIGCCSIPVDGQPIPIFFKINRNKEKSKLAVQNVKAFFHSYMKDDTSYYFSDYKYTHEDLESSDAVNGMDFYYVVLAWVINDQPTCETAKEDNTTYACVSENSRCTTNRMRTGYTCSCSQNYKGNPYILGGCQDFNHYNRSRPKSNCTQNCGNVIIPFPFGLTEGCYGRESFRLECKNGQLFIPNIVESDSYLSTEVAKNYQVMDVLVEEGLLQVKMPLNKSYSLAVEDKTYTSTGQWTNLSWVISNIKCQDAKQNQNYACVSTNSACLYTSVAKFGFGTVGYRCKCNPGYQGNPYVEHGCTDVDECSQPSPVCDEMCSNTAGSYKCWKCPSGTDFNSVKRKCVKNGHTSLLLGIIIGISSGIGVLLFAVCIILITRKLKKDEQKRIRKKHFNKNQGLLLQHLISSDENIADKTKVFSLLELETATNNFDPARILGQGGHGTVYKGILLDQRVVAIKRAKLVNASEINQFINEVALLSQIIHRNVVKLYGCCLETEVPLLVYEFISNGTLHDKLHKCSDRICSLTWEDRLRIAAEAAGALGYLHSAASISIFHRDLKSSNILLDDNYTAKLSDFGASRSVPMDQKQVLTAVQGTFGYLDPEYYHTGQLSEKSDVYSFGVILVKLLTRKKPIFTNSFGEPINLSNCFLQALKGGSFAELLDNEVLEESTSEEMTDMFNLVEMCLKMRGEERPTMKEVEMRLQFIKTSREKHGRSGQTSEEGNQPLLAPDLVYTSSDNNVNWVNQDTTNQESLEKQFMLSMDFPR